MCAAPVIAFLDTETTGTNHWADRVIEIGVVRSDGDSYSTLVDPGTEIPADAVAIHGITNEMVRGAPPFRAGLLELHEFLRAGEPVACVGAHNAEFDRNMISAECLRAFGRCPPWALAPWIDTLIWSRHVYKTWHTHKLEHAAQRLGIVPMGEAHRALADADTALRLWQTMGIDGQLDSLLKRQKTIARSTPWR